MLFTTHLFLFGFLPITLAGFWALRAPRLRLVFLALASYVFYAWWDWRFLPLMLASTTTDYLAALLLDRTDDPVCAGRSWRAPSRSTSACSRSSSTWVLPRVGQRHRLGPHRRSAVPRAGARPADRDLVLHVQLDLVHDRRLRRRIPADRNCCATRPSSRSSRT